MDSCKAIKKKYLDSSFTLIEILVVSTIIGLLAGAGITGYNSLTKASRDAKRKSDLASIQSTLEQYRNDNPYKSYPSNASFSVSCGASGGLAQGGKTYLAKTLTDPKCPYTSYVYNAMSASSSAPCIPWFGSCPPPAPVSVCNDSTEANPCVSYYLYALVEDYSLGACKTICGIAPCPFYCLGPDGPK